MTSSGSVRRRLLLGAFGVLCAGSALMSAGCGYSLSGRGSFLPSYIKTIGIPNFTNRTNVFNIETQVTQKVRSEFIGRGKYQIVPDATGVDAVLTGEIVSATVTPSTVSTTPGVAGQPGQALATGNIVILTVRVELRSLHDDTVIWQNPAMSFREEYATQNARNVTDPNAFFGQDATALERLSTDFAKKIVSDILEAF
jgi:hypothetical protein